jgi:hypothetical protein
VDQHRKHRIAVGRLRKTQADQLSIVIEDVLRRPLGQIDPGTLADLFALADVPEQLSTSDARSLGAFRDQMVREMGDLPDGPVLARFFVELAELDPRRAPAPLRAAVRDIAAARRHEEVVPVAERLALHWAQAEPEDLVLPRPEPAAPVARGNAVKPAQKTGRIRQEVLPPAPRPGKAKDKDVDAAPAPPSVDQRREEWIREGLLEQLQRVKNDGGSSLKESVVVGGARHRARDAYPNLSDDDVLTVLRKLKREGRVRFSAGRWSAA